ncbi:tyrosine-protein phosphatase [Tepidiforma sp.]|uniref:tyrosine-protein phosphatase n=1 Tax=Tepidiforma sp. TaxID=2682230 RepID=UPI002ADDF63B|nr:tyrosine-protein phosphatase [Tepidiforma sp.]
MNETAVPRDLQGVHNFRPVGPYRVAGGRTMQPGRIYRSGALEPMTPADRALLEHTIGLRTILDLRHPDEFVHAPEPHPLSDRVIRLSLFPERIAQEGLIAELNALYGPGPSPGRYLQYLEIGGDRIARAFELFAEDHRYPVLVHCTAGKDRTGVLIGLIMDVLGADPADIAHEYALSNGSIDRLLAYLRASGRQLEGTEEEIRARLATPPDHMAGFIELLHQRYGGAEPFFLRQGVSQRTIDAVRELLIG